MSFRLGIVGGGFVAGFHARALASVREVEIAGLYTPSGPVQLARWVQANGLGEGAVYTSVEELTANAEVVALFGPNFARLEAMEAVVRAVQSGAKLRAIVCEKPLARNMAEARRMLDLAAQTGVPTAYFENQIHLPAIQAARAQLAAVERSMGPLGLARAAEEHGGPHNAWFWDPLRQGGGVLSDMGCHSIAVGWYLLTPAGRAVDYLRPIRVSAEVALLKWGQPRWRQELSARYGVDYEQAPAEDFATGVVTFEDPESGRQSMAQFTVSWMYDKQGVRLFIDGLGAGYALEVNTLRSPLEIFIGDAAAAGVDNAEIALEKATASRGLMPVQTNEPDIYGYIAEWRDFVAAVRQDRDPLLDWSYGLEIVRLTMAAYLSAEERRAVDLTDLETLQSLENYVPLIQQGRGRDTLHVVD